MALAGIIVAALVFTLDFQESRLANQLATKTTTRLNLRLPQQFGSGTLVSYARLWLHFLPLRQEIESRRMFSASAHAVFVSREHVQFVDIFLSITKYS